MIILERARSLFGQHWTEKWAALQTCQKGLSAVRVSLHCQHHHSPTGRHEPMQHRPHPWLQHPIPGVLQRDFAPWPSIHEIAAAVNAGEASALAMAVEALCRIAVLDSPINAFVHVDKTDVVNRAMTVDQRIAAGEQLPLAGVPVTIKDNIWVKGMPITQGSNLFRDFIAPADAIAVERLVTAGAVIIGITNTSEFACSGQTRNLLHGATRNPLDLARTPGGSSGGPVAAVAAGMVPLAIGTDAGGSSRRPPAHTGLVGFKPSGGAIPYGPGFEEPFFGTSCICPIARTVEDAAAAFEVMAGVDRRDPHSAAIELLAAFDPGTIRMALTPKWGLDVPVDAEVRENIASVFARLKASGWQTVELDPVWPPGAAETGLSPIQHAGLAAIHGAAFAADPDAVHPDVAGQIRAGLAFSGADVVKALLLSEAVAQAASTFFTDHHVDVLIGPTTPCTAWLIDQLGPATIDGVPVGPRGHAVFTPLFNHARQPAISIPCGHDRKGLPIGLQLVAQRGKDRQLLAIAAAVETMLGMSPGS
jgi:aspartyl-tRNA(Asn)/glutamyl-tRNA(Gln) amidotransferase subunit A